MTVFIVYPLEIIEVKDNVAQLVAVKTRLLLKNKGVSVADIAHAVDISHLAHALVIRSLYIPAGGNVQHFRKYDIRINR